MEVLNKMTNPTKLVPKRRIKAPTPVTKVATPFQALFPKIPAFVMVAKEIKKSRLPITTLGWPSGILNFETKKAKDKKIKGRNIVVQEKYLIKKSFSFTRRTPCLAKETITRPAREKKNICAIDKIVAFLSLILKAFFDFALRLFAIFSTYIIC